MNEHAETETAEPESPGNAYRRGQGAMKELVLSAIDRAINANDA